MLTSSRTEREYEVFAELPAGELFPGAQGTTIIQGRADMLFIKDSRVVIVDYKSDSAGNLERELPAYSKQLELYKRILPLLIPECRDGHVDMAIYSFGQQRAIFI